MTTTLEILAQTLQLLAPTGLPALRTFEAVLGLLEHQIPDVQAWLEYSLDDIAVRSQLAAQTRHYAMRLGELRMRLDATFSTHLLALPVPELLERFRTFYRGPFRFIRYRYWGDLRRLQGESRAGRLSYRQAVVGLKRAEELLQLEAWFAQHDPQLQERFGSMYQGPNGTNWGTVCTSLEWVEALLGALGMTKVPAPILDYLHEPEKLRPFIKNARLELISIINQAVGHRA